MAGNPACKVCFVGAGSVMPEHLRAFADVPGVALAGIQNRTREKAAALSEQFDIPLVADGIDDLYRETRADLVVVAVNEAAILDTALKVLEYPWAVLLEKPVGLNLDEAEVMAKAAEDRAAPTMVGLNRRAMSSTRAANQDLSDISAPRFIHVQDQQSQAAAREAGYAETVVRHWMYANSIHLIDYLCHFGRGKVVAVEPILPWREASPGVVLARVGFDSGDEGLYEGIWDGPGPWACTVTTRERRWELRPLEHARFQDAGSRAVHDVSQDDWDELFKPGFRRQAEQMALAARGEDAEICTLREAMESMRLVRSIFGV